MDEIWKPVVGLEGFYEVSNLGRVVSLPKSVRPARGGEYFTPKRFLSQTRMGGRYSVVMISCRKHRGVKYVHRLVAEAFIGPAPDGMICCHNNGNMNDNRLDNLRWDTHKNNTADMAIHGTKRLGCKSHMAKLTDEIVREIRSYKGPQKDLQEKYGVKQATISHAFTRKTWKHVK
jgi:hypothetical protein